MTDKLDIAERNRLIQWAYAYHIDSRSPDFIIGTPDNPYLLRWYVIRNGQRWLDLPTDKRQHLLATSNPREDAKQGRNLYVHKFLRSDDDRALHDHPWSWRTVILDGEYMEHRPLDSLNPAGPTKAYHRRAGDVGTIRAGTESHRVELIDNQPALTLFFTGEREREWGFWCHWGWRHWREFTSGTNSGQVGRGCE